MTTQQRKQQASNHIHLKVLHALNAHHKGKANGIGARMLANSVGLIEESGPRTLRKVISELRESGVPIAGMPDTGYFIAATAEELDAFCIKFLEARAMHSLRLSSKLRRVPLATLAGQLFLNDGANL
jgi:predicted DNA-binding transcriptional regulator YafY